MKREIRDHQINRLLHDAEHADSGEMMARLMGDSRNANKYKIKAAQLREKANYLDPKHEATAWRTI